MTPTFLGSGTPTFHLGSFFCIQWKWWESKGGPSLWRHPPIMLPHASNPKKTPPGLGRRAGKNRVWKASGQVAQQRRVDQNQRCGLRCFPPKPPGGVSPNGRVIWPFMARKTAVALPSLGMGGKPVGLWDSLPNWSGVPEFGWTGQWFWGVQSRHL